MAIKFKGNNKVFGNQFGETFYENKTREILEKYLVPEVAKFVRPTLEGDPEAAYKLSSCLDNKLKGIVTVALWKAKVPTSAFNSMFENVWANDSWSLVLAVQSRRSLKAMFQYANFSIAQDLPDTFRVWRGTSGLNLNQARQGFSWTTDRDMACWFALRCAEINGNPLVVSTVISKDSVLYQSNDRNENEYVLMGSSQATIDGTLDDWLERRDFVMAERKKEEAEELEKMEAETEFICYKAIGERPSLEFYKLKMINEEKAILKFYEELGIYSQAISHQMNGALYPSYI